MMRRHPYPLHGLRPELLPRLVLEAMKRIASSFSNVKGDTRKPRNLRDGVSASRKLEAAVTPGGCSRYLLSSRSPRVV